MNRPLLWGNIVCGVLVSATAWGQGIIFPWVGPTNRALGGAATAAPLDAISTTYWNPAAMSDMPENSLSVGVDLLFPELNTASGILGLASGSTSADPGPIPIPNIGWVYHPEAGNWSFGLSVATVGGAKTNYPSSVSNPLFLPQSNQLGFPGGVGRVDTSAQFLQIMPSLGWALTERWSVALSPTLTMGQAAVDPFLFAAPDDADGSGAARYPQGSGARMQWGGGFQVSSYFKINERWSSGAMYRSAQWLHEVENQSTDELGRPRTVTANFDLPQIVSVGVSYQGIPETVVAFDARYIGYASSPGWGDSGYRGDGSLAGLGFGDAYMLGAGIQRRLGSHFTARGGYTFNSSLLSDSEATIGVFAPLFYQHVYSLGGAIHLGAQTDFNFAYSYSPENQLSGPIVTPAGAIPGSNVTTQISVHAASMGVSVRY